MGFAGYLAEQSFVSSNNQLINVEGCVTQAAFESFTDEGINPGFVTLTMTLTMTLWLSVYHAWCCCRIQINVTTPESYRTVTSWGLWRPGSCRLVWMLRRRSAVDRWWSCSSCAQTRAELILPPSLHAGWSRSWLLVDEQQLPCCCSRLPLSAPCDPKHSTVACTQTTKQLYSPFETARKISQLNQFLLENNDAITKV